MEIKEKITELVRSKKTQLPTLPVIVNNIMSAARDDRTSAKDLADFIIKDQAISNKILRLANSAYYGMMKEVDSIPRAITIIGFNEVISLTIGMSVLSAFHQKDLHEIFDIRDLWLHALGCATAAKEIAKKTTGSGMAEQIFLNGLLHDMGKIILAEYFPNEYREVLEDAKESQMPLHRKERQALGIDHAMLSGLLMERWHFPDNLLLPPRFHHNSLECPLSCQHNAMIVEFADMLCQKAGIGNGGNPVVQELKTVRQKLGIALKDMEAIIEGLKEQRSEIEEFLEIVK
ncbi:MAG: HDOD domain-containing protein [Deltaproteobacteria bacterium]|nr:HDOD domain-containing protein [Deltaproteobacteria bacterium]